MTLFLQLEYSTTTVYISNKREAFSQEL